MEQKESSLNATRETPLVSIIVITYNSSKFIIETLESAKLQSYKNLELIVSDDCSPDNTLDICKNWINENKSYFLHTKIIEVEQNTGIIGNCNRSLKEAKGDWVKFIAGDDLLTKNCVEDLVDYCKVNNDCKVVFGRTYILQNNETKPFPRKKISYANLEEQKKIIFTSRPSPGINAPTSFLHKNTLLELGGFDDAYEVLEDLPLWAKFMNNNIRLHFLDKFVTKYRIHEENISGNRSKKFMNTKLYKDRKKYVTEVLFPYNSKKGNIGFFLHFYNYFFIQKTILLLGNKNNLLSKIISLFIVRDTIDKITDLIKQKINE